MEVFFMFKRLFSARRWLALCGLVTVLILAFLAVISPQQLPVIAYKAGLVSFAACLGVVSPTAFDELHTPEHRQ